jgi:hypothetical protein
MHRELFRNTTAFSVLYENQFWKYHLMIRISLSRHKISRSNFSTILVSSVFRICCIQPIFYSYLIYLNFKFFDSRQEQELFSSP